MQTTTATPTTTALAGAQLTSSPIIIPDLAAGEIHVAAIITASAKYHLILLPGDFLGPHAAMLSKAAELGGDLPTRPESALLFAELKNEFKEEWYWTNAQHASDESFAWLQYFLIGTQYCNHKGLGCRARAVRRVPIQ